jgi:hypothetical protein
MFFNKSTLALAFVALANLVSAGQTPACLLSVIGYVDSVDMRPRLRWAFSPKPLDQHSDRVLETLTFSP